ncbi:MAG: F0F1 ATP synthase subunit alpha, partial [Deltaproteobacteria bacterium]|nr:F0F1 ATP synthase subunit alpha [Deltaproteobacteria bacterium]
MSRQDQTSQIFIPLLTHTFDILDQALADHSPSLEIRDVGTITFVGSGIVHVSGLRGVRSEELIRFNNDRLGMVFNTDPKEIGVVLLDESDDLNAGDEVIRMDRALQTPVGEALIGRVMDAQGRPLDNKGPIRTGHSYPVERPAPSIMDRSPVTVPLQTGIKVVDALIPIGRGQRELIIGDRQTGKTAIAVDTIINQQEGDVICIYCAVGKQASAVAKVIADLQKNRSMSYTMVVVSTEEDPPGMQFITPYAAMSMGEYFMEQGKDVLLVLDDLTRHARA